jgi:hypothetical protein
LHSGEDAGDIEIVIIDVPEVSRETTSVHRAEDLAGRLRWTEERRKAYRDEFLFEWEIPEGWVVPSSQSVYASAARPASLWTDSVAGTLRLERAISRGRGSFRMNGSRTLEGF